MLADLWSAGQYNERDGVESPVDGPSISWTRLRKTPILSVPNDLWHSGMVTTFTTQKIRGDDLLSMPPLQTDLYM